MHRLAVEVNPLIKISSRFRNPRKDKYSNDRISEISGRNVISVMRRSMTNMITEYNQIFLLFCFLMRRFKFVEKLTYRTSEIEIIPKYMNISNDYQQKKEQNKQVTFKIDTVIQIFLPQCSKGWGGSAGGVRVQSPCYVSDK